jgi:hypothetical protein
VHFDELDRLIPKVPADKDNLHTNTMYISGGFGWSVRVKWPGKHPDSEGDFVVEVLSEGVWDDYFQFKHSDFFEDILVKAEHSPEVMERWVGHLLAVVQGKKKPARLYPLECDLPGVHLDALTNAMQVLTVCEFRRFPQGDVRGGGRYLPVNYALAMLQGHWTAEEASSLMRKGFPALRDLDEFTPFRRAHSVADYMDDFHIPATRDVENSIRQAN